MVGYILGVCRIIRQTEGETPIRMGLEQGISSVIGNLGGSLIKLRRAACYPELFS